MLAVGAVVVGAAQRDRAEHRVDRLGAVGDEAGLVPGAAVDARPTVPGVPGKQRLEQRRAQRGHRGADRGLHHGQALTLASGAEAGRGQLGQAGHLGRERLLERGEEPPFWPSAAAGASCAALVLAPSASGEGGLASQISSFTARIASLSVANSR